VPLRLIFDAPTIAEMAAIITENPFERAGAPKLARMSRKTDSVVEEDGSG
jgi:hypothetical protein